MTEEQVVGYLRGSPGGPPGIPVLGLSAMIDQGLPVAALDRVAASLAPGDSAFAFRIVPRATLDRRRKKGMVAGEDGSTLPPEEGARVARLASVWALAVEVWGDEDAARDFLFRPHMLLEMRKPMDVVLANEFGRPLVEGILGRLQHGTAV